MTDKDQKRLYLFKRLDLRELSGGDSKDAQGFVDRCHSIICTKGIVELPLLPFN